MSVAIDAHSGSSGGTSGNHSHIYSISVNNSGGTQANFQTVGASATFLLVYICTAQSSAQTSAWTVKWAAQTMTQIGSNVFSNNGTGSNCVALFGLVSPTTGSQTISVANSNAAYAGGQLCYVGGISFTGTVTSSVAAATEGNATNHDTGTAGTQGSVTTSVSIPNTDMAVAAYNADASNWADPKTPSNGTLEDTDGALSTGMGSVTYTGAGSTIASTWDISGTDHWAAAIVGLVASGATQNPFALRDYPNPIPLFRIDETWTKSSNISFFPIRILRPQALL